MIEKIYFDNNSTSLLKEDIKSIIFENWGVPANPSSIHFFGRSAKAIVENSRKIILASLNADPEKYDLVFVSSGTESNNLALSHQDVEHYFCSSIEHLSVLETIKLKPSYKIIKVDSNGNLILSDLEEKIRKADGKFLLSLGYANNETGVIQNLKEITALVKKYKGIIHSDAVQAYGKINIDLNDLASDLITISCHKIGGPVGVGALIYRKNLNLKPMHIGGSQERNLRAGTESVALIAGFAELATRIKNYVEVNQALANIRNSIEQKILSYCPHALIISSKSERLPNTSCIYMPNVESQLQLLKFDLANIAISAGSACSSGKMSISHVVNAISGPEIAKNTIRLSLGYRNNQEEADRFTENWIKIYNSYEKGKNE